MRKTPIACVVLALVALCGAPASAATPGTLDRSFSGGLALQGFGLEPGAGGASRVAPQADGKAVVLIPGTYNSFGYSLGRLSADGSVDTGFGSGGYVSGDFGAPGSQAVDLALQPDGKILVAGRLWLPRRFAVTRYTPDGGIDTSFGDGGTAVFGGAPGALAGSAGGMLLQPDGKIVLSGVETLEAEGQLEVVRLHADGGIDRSFGNGGAAVIPIGDEYSRATEQALALHEDRLTIAVGEEGKALVVRLGPTGAIDRSLSTTGVTSVVTSSRKIDLAVQPDGRIVVAGGTVTRLLPDGSPDPSFGSGGVVQMPTKVAANSIAPQPDGRLLLGGVLLEEASYTPRDFAFLRLNPDGSFDPGLAGGGYVATDIGALDEATALAPLPGGGALLVGQSHPEANYTRFARIAAARYLPDGSLDPSFGAGGTVSTQPLVAARDMVFDLVVDEGGGVYATGRGAGRIATTRFLPNGAPDPAFGNGGSVTATVSGAPLGEQGRSIVRYPDGRLLVGTGSAAGGGLLRYLPSGSPDPSFGAGGTARTPTIDHVFDLALDAEGRILAAGLGVEPCEIVLARFDAGGAPDATFGGGRGAVQTRLAGACRGYNLAVAVAPNGRILFAGTGYGSFVSAYTPRGKRIETFGSPPDGLPGDGLPTKLRDVEVDGKGRIVVAGAFEGAFGLVRLRPDGSADLSFGRRGRVRTPVQLRSHLTEVRLEPGGGIVAAGQSRRCETPTLCPSFLAVARYRPDGGLVRGFGRQGLWLKQVRFGAGLNALALSRGTATVGGWALVSGEERQFLIARLHR